MLLSLNARNVCCTAHFIHIRGHEIKIRDAMLLKIIRSEVYCKNLITHLK